MVDKREHPSKPLDEIGRTTHRLNETTIFRRLEFNRRKVCHVHRICLMLRHPLKLRRHQWSSGDVYIIKGRTKVSKIHSSPISPLSSFTLNKASYFFYNGLQTLRRRLLHLHQTRRHRPTREKRSLPIPSH